MSRTLQSRSSTSDDPAQSQGYIDSGQDPQSERKQPLLLIQESVHSYLNFWAETKQALVEDSLVYTLGHIRSDSMHYLFFSFESIPISADKCFYGVVLSTLYVFNCVR
jgi:hypothetical protein